MEISKTTDWHWLPWMIILLVLWGPLSVHGADIELSNRSPRPGDLVRVTLTGNGLCEPEITMEGRRIPVFQTGNRSRALIGIDLESSPRRTSLSVRLDTCETSHDSPETIPLRIQAGDYPTQRLTIEDTGRVTLSPEDLKRVRRESRRVEHALGETEQSRLWERPLADPLEQLDPGHSFGSRRIINGQPRSPHGGEDYSAGTGEPVRSIANGRAVLVDELFFAGKAVFVDHGQGLQSMYFHLSDTAVQTGDRINKGELIGRVGSTGRVTGPHLHLGIRVHGATVNPRQLLSADD